jgi:Zn-dependent peptidase ImmA (M78 family)
MEGFNSQVLTAVLHARHLSITSVSDRLGRSNDDVQAELERSAGPSQTLINDLSKELVVPSFVFFMETAPALDDDIVDFREGNPSYTEKTRATIESIDMARRLQELAKQFDHSDALDRGLSLTEICDPAFASSVRNRLGIDDAVQLGCKDSAAFYATCRAAVEKTGIFVLHESFPAEDGSGFCLANSPARIIVVNTLRQNRARRNFTLAHELAHAFLGKTGISDPFVTQNTIEKCCNTFAAQFLLPAALVEAAFNRFGLASEPSLEDIYRCATYLRISQQATVVRFEQLGLAKRGLHEAWLRAVEEKGNPDWISKGGGGGPTPQEKVKLAKYGFTFAKVFGAALDKNFLSPLEIYRASGLKPKYQRPYFSFAASAEPLDAEG